MYDTDTLPPCASLHHRVANEWLRRDERVARWFVQPARLGKDFIKIHQPVGKFGKRGYRQANIDLTVSAFSIHPSADAQPAEVEQPLEKQFAIFSSAWREASENVSSLTQILSHPAYQLIIDLGKRGQPVVPLILKDLETHRGYWATALQTITGENPVPPKHIGNPSKVREDWLEWGRRRGYL